MNKMKLYPFSKKGDATLHLKHITKHTDEFKNMIMNFMLGFQNATLSSTDEYKKFAKQTADNRCKMYEDINCPEFCRSYEIVNDDKIIGYVQTIDRRYRGQLLGGTGNQIDVLYVKPQYRGWGIATRVYRMLQELGVNQLSLAYRSIDTLDKIEYWQKLGYQSIRIVPGEKDWSGSMIVLDTAKPVGYAFEFTHKGIALARHHMNKIAMKFKKHQLFKQSYSQDKPYYDIDANLVNRIIDNHFQSKKIIQKQLEEA